MSVGVFCLAVDVIFALPTYYFVAFVELAAVVSVALDWLVVVVALAAVVMVALPESSVSSTVCSPFSLRTSFRSFKS